MTIHSRLLLLFACALGGSAAAGAQTLYDEILANGEIVTAADLPPVVVVDSAAVNPEEPIKLTTRRNRRSTPKPPSLWDLTDSAGVPLDPLNFGAVITEGDSTLDVSATMFPPVFYMPVVFDTYRGEMPRPEEQPLGIFPERGPLSGPATAWAEDADARIRRQQQFLQTYMIANPQRVAYNMATLPRAPKVFTMTVDPTQEAHITIVEQAPDTHELKAQVAAPEIRPINWIHEFDASLQFSQAYVSPNWYQGGTSNLNAIANLLYHVYLNQKYHPNLLCDLTMQYTLGINNAPDDSLHSYNISQDLLQINAKFGLKAIRHWYYSVTGQLKTQLLNNYRKNSRDLMASFMSPGDINVGIGMTYEHQRKNFKLNASIAPFSYNLKTCINTRIDPTSLGIHEGHTTISQYGSNVEVTCSWKISYNVSYSSRLFLFTDYSYLVGDWENTFNFEINRFLSTRLYGHLRYQSNANRLPSSAWHQWQLKEILSIGFAYRFRQKKSPF